MTSEYDIIIIGAGAAGLMCAAVAGARGKSVLVIDHADKAGEKIRISGGGRCNFTNIHCSAENFISSNPHFCKSALSRYSPQDFINLVNQYKIDWHEKTKGQLFCDGSSQQIIDMLLSECEKSANEIRLSTLVLEIKKFKAGYIVTTTHQSINGDKIVIACGGPSIPKMGASGYGYKVAEQFGLPLIPPVPALVPLTFTDQLKAPLKALSGVSTNSRVHAQEASFDEALLFTHRGLSGPAILQISSYWSPGDAITLDLAPDTDILAALKSARTEIYCGPNQTNPSRRYERRRPKQFGVNGQSLARQTSWYGRFSNCRSHQRRGGHRRAVLKNDGSQICARTLFHRRSR